MAELTREVMEREILAAQARQGAQTTEVDPKQVGPMDEVPLSVRIAVAGARPEDKLATLQRWTGAGKARLIVTGGESVEDGRPVYREPQQQIVFTHPGAPDRPDLKGKLQRYDPHWYDPAPLLQYLGDNPLTQSSDPRDPLAQTGLQPVDTRTMKERTGDAIGETAGQTVGIPLEGMGQAIGAESKFGANLLKNAKKVEMFDVAGKGRPGVLEDMKGLDISPKGATPMLTESQTVQGMWNAASKSPRAGDRIRNAWNETWADIQSAWRKTVTMRGNVEQPQDLSEVLGKRWEDYGKAASQTQEEMEAGTAALRKSEDTATPATQAAVDKLLRRGEVGGKASATAKDTVSPFVQRLAQTLQEHDGVLPFEDLRTLRQTYDAKAGWGKDVEGSAEHYREIANAIRSDLSRKMKDEGPAAEQAWGATMEHWADHKETQRLLGPIMQSKNPGQTIATQIANGTMDRPTLAALRSIASDDLWDNTARTSLVKLGEVTRAGGAAEDKAFSMPDFAKRWKGLDDKVRDMLYAPGTEQRKNLDALARISNAYADAEASRAYRGAASQNAFFGAIEGGPGKVVSMVANAAEAVGAPLKTAKKLATGVGELRNAWNADDAAKLLTDPAFQKWLIDGGKIKPGASEEIAGHIAGLRNLMLTRPGIREQIVGYMQNLKAHLQQQAEGDASGEGGGEEQPQTMRQRIDAFGRKLGIKVK